MTDTFNYYLAGEWADAVRAIFIIESEEHVNVVGDGGRAFGPGQIHPAFFIEFYRDPDVSDTWADAQIKAVATFFRRWRGLGRDVLVAGYNKGLTAVTRDGVTAFDYVERFNKAFASINGKWPIEQVK